MNAKQFWDDFAFEYVLDEPGLFTDLISIEGYKQAASMGSLVELDFGASAKHPIS